MEFKFLAGPEVLEAEKQIPDDQKVNWPVDSIVMYCFEGDTVIGRMGIMSFKIVEGTWADPSKQGTTLAFRMMKQMEAMVAYLGEPAINAFSADSQAEVGEYLERYGFERLPITLYTKALVKKKEAA
jgi:hypothetical protein